MRYLIISALLLNLVACGGVFQRPLPDGRMSYYVSCNGYQKTYDRCYAEANERCGAAGYDVLQQDRFTESESEAGSSQLSYGQGIWMACKEVKK